MAVFIHDEPVAWFSEARHGKCRDRCSVKCREVHFSLSVQPFVGVNIDCDGREKAIKSQMWTSVKIH